MGEFLKGFRRDEDGSWTCVTTATYNGSEGRITVAPGTVFTRGTVFMGVELAAWLESQLRPARQR